MEEKITFEKLAKHLGTVHTHRKYVREACFKMGIPWQGLVHDLSKYSITELKICKYYIGTKSPHQVCREKIGYSPSWISHYHKNRHHHDFWLDEDEFGKFIPIKMPYKYIIESFCDMVGAGKAYNKEKWTTRSPWEYWEAKCIGQRIMHTESVYLLNKLLEKMRDFDKEDDFYTWYKNNKEYLKYCYESGYENY